MKWSWLVGTKPFRCWCEPKILFWATEMVHTSFWSIFFKKLRGNFLVRIFQHKMIKIFSFSILIFTFDPEFHIQPYVSHLTLDFTIDFLITLNLSHLSLNFTFNLKFHIEAWISSSTPNHSNFFLVEEASLGMTLSTTATKNFGNKVQEDKLPVDSVWRIFIMVQNMKRILYF